MNSYNGMFLLNLCDSANGGFIEYNFEGIVFVPPQNSTGIKVSGIFLYKNITKNSYYNDSETNEWNVKATIEDDYQLKNYLT